MPVIIPENHHRKFFAGDKVAYKLGGITFQSKVSFSAAKGGMVFLDDGNWVKESDLHLVSERKSFVERD